MSNKFDEFVLKIEELPILFNVLYNRGNYRYTLFPYLLSDALYQISLGETVELRLQLSKSEYYELMNRKNLFEFSEIIPKYGVIRASLIGSGFLKMKNWAQVKKKLDHIKSIDPLKGERYTFIGLDTNCFMHRIYSVMNHEYVNEMDNFYFVLSEIVLDELRSTQKISNSQLNSLKNKLTGKNKILAEFWNNDNLKTRKRRIGLIEFNKMRTHSKCLMNEGVTINKKKDKDIQILQDFKSQILPQHYNLLFLSSDKQIVHQARGPGVPSYYLELPPLNVLATEYSGKWNMLCDFIYLNCIYFGAVSLRGTKDTIQLFGLWRGKNIHNWDLESIKVKIGSTDLSNQVKKQLAIIRKFCFK